MSSKQKQRALEQPEPHEVAKYLIKCLAFFPASESWLNSRQPEREGRIRPQVTSFTRIHSVRLNEQSVARAEPETFVLPTPTGAGGERTVHLLLIQLIRRKRMHTQVGWPGPEHSPRNRAHS